MIWQNWNKADRTLLAAAVIFLFALCLQVQYPGNVFAAGFLFCAEAALVGGIADWFAVTALFEKPLGFPWHTAILPRRRQSFIEATGRMLQREFFGKKALVAKVKRIDFDGKLLGWLERPESRQLVAKWLATRGRHWLEARDGAAMPAGLAARLGEMVAGSMTPERIGSFLLYGAKELEFGARQPEFADKVESVLSEYIDSKLQGPMAMMMAGFAQSVNVLNTEEAAGLIQDRCLLFLERVQQEDSEEREQLHAAAEKISCFLQKNFAARQELDHAVLNSVQRLNLNEYLFNATDEDEKIDGQLQELAEGILQVVYEMLRENSSLQREVSGICYQLAARGVMQAQEMLGSIAGDVLGTMTDEQINRLVYDKAEPDLLWIRMNGSIVGAAIGLVLFAVMQFI
ncbi:MAG: DUF445 domain-containing protein [Anaerovibrio sp.]|uniref:DUF445 domain-containing protein n=1 Tax=Anaerovibrio sp. TaxID=1872532 RepID=UPI00262256A8|nr:DUF445 domain-containing protein [Anaerovibrio sp.]MDD7678235.1 DUF445 domain-containing protein [Anaerovibrio sp.]MDY2604166.1 DUF445 domain-containing protein [Anaerovibrio sp.]